MPIEEVVYAAAPGPLAFRWDDLEASLRPDRLDRWDLFVVFDTDRRTVEEGVEHANRMLDQWQAEAGARSGVLEFRYQFVGASISDGATRHVPTSANVAFQRTAAPAPPVSPLEDEQHTLAVSVWRRFENWRSGREPLQAAAYAALTILWSQAENGS